MESGTVETSTGTGSAANGAERRRRRADRGPQPGDRRTGRRRSPSTHPRRSRRRWLGCAATRPGGRRSGSRAATTGSGKLRDWLLDNIEQVSDTIQAETGKVRADVSLELFYVTDLINFYGSKAAKFIGEETRAPAHAAARREEARDPVPAPPGRRRHQPLELPARDGARRLDPGAPGRRRGRRQALRVHAAQPDRGDRGLEGGDRRPRRLRLRAGHRRGRRRARRRGRLRPVHRLGPDRAQGDGARGRDADPGQPRARRQGPDDRPRRRRPRPRRQRRRLGLDVQLGPGLPLGRADLRRGARLRRVRREADQGGRAACARAPTAAAPKRTSARSPRRTSRR